MAAGIAEPGDVVSTLLSAAMLELPEDPLTGRLPELLWETPIYDETVVWWLKEHGGQPPPREPLALSWSGHQT
jgi:hypothetical protein